MQRKRGTPAAGLAGSADAPFGPGITDASDSYFSQELAVGLQTAQSVGWSPEQPAEILLDRGKYTWPVAGGPAIDAISLARHAAMCDDGSGPADLTTLAEQSRGAARVGRPARRRRQPRHPPAPRADHRRARPALGHVQAVLRRRTRSAVLDAGVLAQGHHPLLRRRRLRGLRRLGRADRAGARDAAAVPPLHRREPEGLSRTRRQDHHDGAGDRPRCGHAAGRGLRRGRADCSNVAKSTDKDCIFLLGPHPGMEAAGGRLRPQGDDAAAWRRNSDSPRRFLAELDRLLPKGARPPAAREGRGSRLRAALAGAAAPEPGARGDARPRTAETAHAPDQRDPGQRRRRR